MNTLKIGDKLPNFSLKDQDFYQFIIILITMGKNLLFSFILEQIPLDVQLRSVI